MTEEERVSYGVYSPLILSLLLFGIILCFILYLIINDLVVRYVFTVIVIVLAMIIGLLFYESTTPLRVKKSALLVEFAQPREVVP